MQVDRISNTNYNTSFNGRFLVIPENYEKQIMFPRNIKAAIQKNKAITDFISDGNPKAPRTFWQKLKDAFHRDEVLEVTYNNELSAWSDSVLFRFGKKGSKKVRTYQMKAEENDRKAITGYSDYTNVSKYRDRHDKFMELFTRKVEIITDFESLLSKNTTKLSKPL